MKRLKSPLGVFLILVLFSKNLTGQVMQLDSLNETTRLIGYIEMFNDKTNELKIEDIIHGSASFVPISGNQIGKAFDPSTFWFRLILSSSQKQKQWVIECPNVLLDSLTLFVPEVGSATTGMFIPMNTRPISGSTLAFDLPEIAGMDTIYLRSRSGTLSEVPLRLVTLSDYQDSQTNKNFLFGILIGVFAFFALLILVTYLIKKEVIFLLLFFYTVVSTLNNGHFSGLSFFLYPESEFFLKWITIVQVDITFWLIIAYSSMILEVKQSFPGFNKFFRYIYFLPLLMLVTPFFIERHISVMIHAVVPQFAILLFGIWGIFCYRKGNRNAIFYSMGWLFHFAFLVPYMLSNFGLLPSNLFTENSGGIGLLIELIFFTIASSLYFTQKMQEREFILLNQTKELGQARIQLKNYLKNLEKTTESGGSFLHKEAMMKLSEREFDILQRIVDGKNNPAIAEETFVSVNTVKTHIKSIYSKLGVHNRVELVKKIAASS